MVKPRGPEFLRFAPPIVETLKELGNSGHPRVRNQIGWARFYLTKAGLMDASQRGVWALTEEEAEQARRGLGVRAFQTRPKTIPAKAHRCPPAGDTRDSP